jgi:hypothetical protein
MEEAAPLRFIDGSFRHDGSLALHPVGPGYGGFERMLHDAVRHMWSLWAAADGLLLPAVHPQTDRVGWVRQ